MKLIKAERKHAKIKVLLQGSSGSGKTFSALLMASGLESDWNKIAIIDSENGSAHLYSSLGDYSVLHLSKPFTPEKYIQALEVVEQAEMEVCIIDSITHEWESILEIHSSMTGNSFTNWGKVTPRHNAFVQKILSVPYHVIATTRTKQDYVLTEKSGKMVPEKVGLKGVQRDGVDYEFTLVFDIDIKHQATASKDRTGLFADKPQFKISSDTGKLIKSWCETGTSIEQVKELIKSCSDLEKLRNIYRKYPSFKQSLNDLFLLRSKQLNELDIDISNDLINLNKTLFNGNGITKNSQ